MASLTNIYKNLNYFEKFSNESGCVRTTCTTCILNHPPSILASFGYPISSKPSAWRKVSEILHPSYRTLTVFIIFVTVVGTSCQLLPVGRLVRQMKDTEGTDLFRFIFPFLAKMMMMAYRRRRCGLPYKKRRNFPSTSLPG